MFILQLAARFKYPIHFNLTYANRRFLLVVLLRIFLIPLLSDVPPLK